MYKMNVCHETKMQAPSENWGYNLYVDVDENFFIEYFEEDDEKVIESFSIPMLVAEQVFKECLNLIKSQKEKE